MPHFQKRGNRIRASDKSLVFRFSAGSLLLSVPVTPDNGGILAEYWIPLISGLSNTVNDIS